MLSYDEVFPANSQLFQAAAAVRDLDLQVIAPHELSLLMLSGQAPQPLWRGEPFRVDAILHRTVFRFLPLLADVLQVCAARGMVVLNDPAASMRSRSKVSTMLDLMSAAVPTVPSLGYYPPLADSLPEQFNAAVVDKPAYGSAGRDVHFEDSVQAVRRAAPVGQAVTQWEEPRLLQPDVGASVVDLRAYVVDGTCVGLMRRLPQAGERRSNLAHGARGEAQSLAHPAARLAERAVAALGLDFAGVDLFEEATGKLLVSEVDAWAGFSGLQAVSGTDIAGAILDFALRRVQP